MNLMFDKSTCLKQVCQLLLSLIVAVVQKDCETMKLGIVYDGSAKASKLQKSLNDSLQTGPNHLQHVFNFCKNIAGLTGDIEKALFDV